MTIAACPKSSPFEGRFPDLHGQKGSLPACRQFPRGKPTRHLKGETSRHQNASAETQDPPSAHNQPLEMLQNYEDWQAETPTIILDIQANEHHTDEELRSLTLEALSVAYPSNTWARAYTDGSA